MERFNHLLEKYLADKATPREVAEFLEMAQDDRNAEILEKVMEERFENNYEGLNSAERLEVLQDIFSRTKDTQHTRRYWMAAASFAALILAGTWLYKTNTSFLENRTPDRQEKAITSSGGDYVSLPDGSYAILKAGSTLTCKESFGEKSRDVTLAGEAFFEVAHDPERPFKVHTGNITTTVLGTAFNVNAAAADGEITVTVTRGKVSVADETRTEIIEPNQQITVKPATREFLKTSVNADSLVKWINDYFILDRVTIAQAAELIGKRFQVEVIIANEDLKPCVISAWFLNNEDLQQVVEAVSAVRRATVKTENGKVIIEGGISCDREPVEESEREDADQ